MRSSAKVFIFVFSTLFAWHGHAVGLEPTGILKCNGVFKSTSGELSYHSATFASINKEKAKKRGESYVEISGLEYGSGNYMYNETSIIIYAPSDCFREKGKGFNFIGCKFNGIVNRVDGSFTFFQGDKDDEPSAYFWSQEKSRMICERVRTVF